MSAAFKERLRRRELIVNIMPQFRSELEAGFIGRSGFDAVFLDCEHGNLSIETVERFAFTARAYGTAAIVRPEDNLRHLIIAYLDTLGVSGIMAPHVETVEEANEIIDAARYGRAQYMGAAGENWDINDKAIIVIIESPKAVENLPALLKIDEIDMFFIGPSDLSAEMGYRGQGSHPKVMEMRERATKLIVGAGKACGTGGTFDSLEHWIAAGVTYFLTPSTMLFQPGAKQYRDMLGSGYKGNATTVR